MNKKTILLAALSLALLACSGGGKAYAYFTTYANAQGGHILKLGHETDIEERFGDWTKHVVITSEEDSEPVYVRAKAFGPEGYPLTYSGDGWIEGDDGFYYYTRIVYGGESTPELLVQITGVPESEYLKDGDNFNVVVVYECTPVLYDAANRPYPADESWGWKGGVS